MEQDRLQTIPIPMEMEITIYRNYNMRKRILKNYLNSIITSNRKWKSISNIRKMKYNN